MIKKPKAKRKRLVLGRDFDGWAAWNKTINDWERHSDIFNEQWKYYCPILMKTKREWGGTDTKYEKLRICRVKIVEIDKD